VSLTTTYFVGCSEEKRTGRHQAGKIYTSERFQAARSLVRANNADWAILSGKYGLVEADRVIEAYDLNLGSLSPVALKKWSTRVFAAIRKRHPQPCRIVVLADEAYFVGWLDRIIGLGYQVSVPTRRLSGLAADWMKSAMLAHPKRRMLEATYRMLEPVLAGTDSFQRFADCKGGSGWPSAGLYLFFDKTEPRLFSPALPKIVRIGTHGVSDGSVSTLWQRMKAHKGDLGGLGNHRTSIFRLHVGTALMVRNSLKCPSWGSATRPSPAELKQEAEIERAVSAYIGQLYVSVLPITDQASKRSDRAYVEQNLIAIMSGLPGPVECASERWLGFYCANPAVGQSSLWNVNHTEERFDPGFLSTLEYYVDVATGKRTASTQSIAPKNWYESSQEGFTQGRLFEGL